MSLYNKIINKFKLSSTKQAEYFNAVHAPKYLTDSNWHQDSEKSITTNDGKYDMKRFSKHESDTIRYIMKIVNDKYPIEYQSIGLANESYIIKYKPRYILHEMIILLYEDSESVIDKFSVSLAYASKGAFFRKKAIKYFEESEPYITSEFMNDFISYMPLHVYTMFSKLYEQEHEYQKAIDCTKMAKIYGDPCNPNFDYRIQELREKSEKNSRTRKIKMSDAQKIFEEDVEEAAKHFLYGSSLGIRKSKKYNYPGKKRIHPLDKYELERFAIECNASLELEDEMNK